MLEAGGQEDHPGMSDWGFRGLVWPDMVDVIVGVSRVRAVWDSRMKGVDRRLKMKK